MIKSSLGHPHSSAIKGSRHAIREPRIPSGGRALRVFYAFDPRRQAVLLLGGDKTGDDRFYETFLPRAESIGEEYLAEQEVGLHDEDGGPAQMTQEVSRNCQGRDP
jgi:hypothetical protein